MKKILVTGGCGFVGSSLAIRLREDFPQSEIICIDNLKRRGSELNLSRFRKAGIRFIHGDIRNKEDLEVINKIDLLVECSAEPSVLAGINSNLAYLINTNLIGTINCLELARKCQAQFVFLSTSRVYPIQTINNLQFQEAGTRFELLNEQNIPGVSSQGFTEKFPLDGARSIYGSTKLASELIVQEYVDMYGLQAVINRCGVITGPWQFGKVDQGVVVFWIARHFWKQKLSYIGFGGTGKQVRDVLHVDDLYDLLKLQLNDMESHSGQIYNVGGGREISISLIELTALCEKYTGNRIEIQQIQEDRQSDIRVYLTDHGKITQATGWYPKRKVEQIIQDISQWILNNEHLLAEILK